jgi:sugar phosphate isomerase/epimerase
MKPTRREMLAACATALPALTGLAARGDDARKPKKSRLGVVIHSYSIRDSDSRRHKEEIPFADPLRFLEFCRERGAAGVQLGLGRRDRDYTTKLREKAAAAGMYLEGSVRLPQDRADVERFTAEMQTAKDAGVAVVRTVCLSGRRYETFDSADAFREFARRAYESLTLAEPVVARLDLRLAVENHKDWRVGELIDLLKRLSSKHVGICLDTGNSIALLEDPQGVVEAYAPWSFTTHLKDMAVAEYEDGFLLAEVPLGTGFLDVPAIVAALRKARPDIRLNLEMITRDPLNVPCLTKKYWATLDSVQGRELAEALARVRKSASRQPLPRVSDLPLEKQIAVEDDNVRRCVEFAAQRLRGH